MAFIKPRTRRREGRRPDWLDEATPAKQRQTIPQRTFIAAFGITILVTTACLLLPAATPTGEQLPFVDALFMATSAVCVTGLVVVDPGTDLSRFGQIVVLIAFQIGGLGIMTYSTFFLYIFGRRLSLRENDAMVQTLGTGRSRSLRALIWTVLIVTFSIEGVGALLLYPEFERILPTGDAIFAAIFHSVSAFCNSGFSLWSDSLVQFKFDPVVNITAILLIICGSIGFMVFLEALEGIRALVRRFLYTRNREAGAVTRPPFRFSTHSRVVLIYSSVLIVLGTVVLLIFEWDSTQADMTMPQRLLTSFFMAVSGRTAGLSTLEVSAFTNASLFFMMLLMFVGGGPGSCAGGIKVSTFAVLAKTAWSKARGYADVVFYGRRIPGNVTGEALALAAIAASMVVFGTLIMQITEPVGTLDTLGREEFVELLFEVTSAFGTTGLSMGITPNLSTAGKLLIILFMFVGRLGPLTFAVALSRRGRAAQYRYPEGRLSIG